MTFDADGRWKHVTFCAAGVNEREYVLDVAAGTGIFTFKMARALHANGSVLGIDVTRPMLEVAKAKHRRLKMPALSGFCCAVAEKLPLRDACVDCWTSCYLMKYCNLQETLSEAMRVLKPGGRVVAYDFTVPSGGLFAWLCRLYIFRLMPALSRLAPTTGFGRLLRLLPRVIAQSTWSEEIVEALSRAGFEAVGLWRLTSGVVTLVSARKSKHEPDAFHRIRAASSRTASA